MFSSAHIQSQVFEFDFDQTPLLGLIGIHSTGIQLPLGALITKFDFWITRKITTTGNAKAFIGTKLQTDWISVGSITLANNATPNGKLTQSNVVNFTPPALEKSYEILMEIQNFNVLTGKVMGLLLYIFPNE